MLLQILSGKQKASDLLPSGSVYGLESNKSVELTIPALVVAGPVRMGFCSDFGVLTPLTMSASDSPARRKSIYAIQPSASMLILSNN